MRKRLITLIGREISGISFMSRHVELHVGTSVVRGFGAPSISVGEANYRFPSAGSRDALCWMIGAKVTEVAGVEGRHAELVTSNGCRISLPLEDRPLEIEGT